MLPIYFTDEFIPLLLTLYLAGLVLYLAMRLRALEGALLDSGQGYQREIALLKQRTHVVIKRLQLSEQRVDEIEQQRLRMRTNPSVEASLTQAGRLMDLGVDAEQLAQGMGLSDAEAKLMSLVHDGKRSQLSSRAGAGSMQAA